MKITIDIDNPSLATVDALRALVLAHQGATAAPTVTFGEKPTIKVDHQPHDVVVSVPSENVEKRTRRTKAQMAADAELAAKAAAATAEQPKAEEAAPAVPTPAAPAAGTPAPADAPAPSASVPASPPAQTALPATISREQLKDCFQTFIAKFEGGVVKGDAAAREMLKRLGGDACTKLGLLPPEQFTVAAKELCYRQPACLATLTPKVTP